MGVSQRSRPPKIWTTCFCLIIFQKFDILKSINTHCILQFGLNLTIGDQVWSYMKFPFTKGFFFKFLFETCLSYMCGLFNIWIVQPNCRMKLIFMDFQIGKWSMRHISRFKFFKFLLGNPRLSVTSCNLAQIY